MKIEDESEIATKSEANIETRIGTYHTVVTTLRTIERELAEPTVRLEPIHGRDLRHEAQTRIDQIEQTLFDAVLETGSFENVVIDVSPTSYAAAKLLEHLYVHLPSCNKKTSKSSKIKDFNPIQWSIII